MGRRSAILAALTGALVLAGCGSAPGPGHQPRAAGVVPGETARVEATDGRLGGATGAEPGRLRELSPGGPLDPRPRTGEQRRDGVGAGASCADAAIAPGPETMAAVSAATLCLLNGERADRGLPALTLNARLTRAADLYAADLVSGSYFSHTGRDGSDLMQRIRRTGYLPSGGGWSIGENLAWGTGALATPGAIMRAWMNSPGHRDNILNARYREIGIGVAGGNPKRGDGAGATYATEFGAVQGRRVAGRTVSTKRAKARRARKASRSAKARAAPARARARAARARA